MVELTDAEAVRADVRAWLDTNWDPDLAAVTWRGRLADAGWACPTWPVGWHGRGLAAPLAAIVDEELARLGAPGAATGAGLTLAGPTILELGSDDLKSRLLRPIVTGEHRWCQLFSEPGSGSDLAGLTTRAERDGDEFVVNGQKVWTTGAGKASYAMLLARTDWDAPKHRGITYFAFPMQQPGVEVRPLAADERLRIVQRGVPDRGARAGRQRRGRGRRRVAGGAGHPRPRAPAAEHPRLPGRRRGHGTGERARRPRTRRPTTTRPTSGTPSGPVAPTSYRPRPPRRATAADADVRQEVAGLVALDRAARWTASRARAARVQGRPPGPEGSIGKLVGSEIARRSAHVHGRMAGAAAMLSGPDSLLDGLVAEILVSVPGQSIAGGTDEIQRNILGERALGLPKEPIGGRRPALPAGAHEPRSLILRSCGATTMPAPREAPAPMRKSEARPKRSGGHAEPSSRVGVGRSSTTLPSGSVT